MIQPNLFLPKRVSLAVLVMACALPSAVRATALGDLAAEMKAGEWKELVTQDLSYDMLHRNANGQVWDADISTSWTNYLAWNPSTQELYWVGAPHLAPYAFLRYSALENRWHNETNVPDCMRIGGYDGCFSHGYDHGTIDPVNGVFYFISNPRVFAYDIAKATWSNCTFSEHFEGGAGSALEWFPAKGKLAHVAGPASFGQMKLIDPVTCNFEILQEGLQIGPYHNTMEYSAPHRKLYFGGGNGSAAFLSMDESNKIVQLADAPAEYSGNGPSLATDPISGDPLLLLEDNSFYAYSASTNTWRPLKSPPEKLVGYPTIGALATGIPAHGVVFYMSSSLMKVYLYKHSDGAAGPSPAGMDAGTGTDAGGGGAGAGGRPAVPDAGSGARGEVGGDAAGGGSAGAGGSLGAGGSVGAGGSAGAGAARKPAAGAGASGGCGCRMAAAGQTNTWLGLLVAIGAAMRSRTRRRVTPKS